MNIEPREPSSDERATLDRLLSADFEGVQALRVQALSVEVVGKCDCGCPTVDLRVMRRVAKSTASSPIPAEAWVGEGSDRSNSIGGVLLFCTGGYLSSMEMYYFYDEPPNAWPSIDQIHDD